jgi:hypothetical protein
MNNLQSLKSWQSPIDYRISVHRYLPKIYKSPYLLVYVACVNPRREKGIYLGDCEVVFTPQSQLGKVIPTSVKLPVNSSENHHILSTYFAGNDFSIELKNLSQSTVKQIQFRIAELKPPLQKKFMLNFGIGDPAPITIDTTAITDAIATQTTSLNLAISSQTASFLAAINPNEVSKSEEKSISTVPLELFAPNPNLNIVVLTNQSNTKIRIWCDDTPLPTTHGFNSGGHNFEVSASGQNGYGLAIPEAFCKGYITAIAQNGSNNKLIVGSGMNV